VLDLTEQQLLEDVADEYGLTPAYGPCLAANQNMLANA
jgi:hypothetical protein